MPRLHKLLAATALVPFALTATFGSDAFATGKRDELACYQPVTDDPVVNARRYVLDVKFHSYLTDRRDRYVQQQVAYSVHGKAVGVCRDGTDLPMTMAVVEGTVVVQEPLHGPQVDGDGATHAHMGLHVKSVRPIMGDVMPCYPSTLDCTATFEGDPRYHSSGATPDSWSCFIHEEPSDTILGPFGLVEVSPYDGEAFERCGVFQNGSFLEELPMTDVTTEEPVEDEETK